MNFDGYFLNILAFSLVRLASMYISQLIILYLFPHRIVFVDIKIINLKYFVCQH